MKKLKNRLLASALTAAMLVLNLSGMTPAVQVAGEESEEFIPIRTIEELYNIRNDLDGNYRLMNDIDLTEAINQVSMLQGAMEAIEGRWLQAMPGGEDFQLSRNQIHYLKNAVETGIVNDDICPLDRVQLQELLEYLESIMF